MLRIAALVATSLLVNVADTMPTFDSAASCRAADAAGRSIIAGTGRSASQCVADENDAKAKVQKQWQSFAPADRATCTATAAAASPSYVELLTCLEMARDVRGLPKDGGIPPVKQ